MEFSISTAAFDGHSYNDAFRIIKNTGVRSVEIALIEGYVADFTEEDWNSEFAAEIRASFENYSLSCSSLACHANLNHDEASAFLLRRVRFAKSLGAKYVILNAVRPDRFQIFLSQLQAVTEEARDKSIRILFENPGDQNDNLINSAADICEFLSHFDREVFGINYDPGNLLSHRPDIDVIKDTVGALEYCEHMHMKDLRLENHQYRFCPLGQGVGQYQKILQYIVNMPQPIFFSLELPFRILRNFKGKPFRIPECVPLEMIESYVKDSVEFVRKIGEY